MSDALRMLRFLETAKGSKMNESKINPAEFYKDLEDPPEEDAAEKDDLPEGEETELGTGLKTFFTEFGTELGINDVEVEEEEDGVYVELAMVDGSSISVVFFVSDDGKPMMGVLTDSEEYDTILPTIMFKNGAIDFSDLTLIPTEFISSIIKNTVELGTKFESADSTVWEADAAGAPKAPTSGGIFGDGTKIGDTVTFQGNTGKIIGKEQVIRAGKIHWKKIIAWMTHKKDAQVAAGRRSAALKPKTAASKARYRKSMAIRKARGIKKP